MRESRLNSCRPSRAALWSIVSAVWSGLSFITCITTFLSFCRNSAPERGGATWCSHPGSDAGFYCLSSFYPSIAQPALFLLRLAVAMLLSTIVDKIAEHERALRAQFVR